MLSAIGLASPGEGVGALRARAECDPLSIVCHGAVLLALEFVGSTSIDEADRTKGIKFDCMLDILNGSLVFPLVNIGGATEHIGSSVARKKLDCFVEILNGVGIFRHRAICLCSGPEGYAGSGSARECPHRCSHRGAWLATSRIRPATGEAR